MFAKKNPHILREAVRLRHSPRQDAGSPAFSRVPRSPLTLQSTKPLLSVEHGSNSPIGSTTRAHNAQRTRLRLQKSRFAATSFLTAMSAPSPHKRPRFDLGAGAAEEATCHEADGTRGLLRSALGATAGHLAKHSAAAQSLVTADEDAVDAAITCCALLLREQAMGLDIAVKALRILANLAEGPPPTWRDLPRLREQPLAVALADSDEAFTQQLHILAELLQFPKHASLLLQRQLAVFRVRSILAAGKNGTEKLVRAEALLAPLLEQADRILSQTHGAESSFCCWDSSLCDIEQDRDREAFWRGFFADSEAPDTLGSDHRQRSHHAYAAGRVLSGRGLLPDMLQAPPPGYTHKGLSPATAAAAVGDLATISALHYAGRDVGRTRCAKVAAWYGQVPVLRLAVELRWDFNVDVAAKAAAEAELTCAVRLQVLAVLREHAPAVVDKALPDLAAHGRLSCVRWLLEVGSIGQEERTDAVASAAREGHIEVMGLLLENGAELTAEAFQASGDVETLEWCRARGCVVDAEFLQQAVLAGGGGWLFHLEWAASVTDVSGLLSVELFDEAASGCDVEVLEWLVAVGCPWDSGVLTTAGDANSSYNFVFLLQRGCPTDDVPLHCYLGCMPLDNLKQGVQALRATGREAELELPKLLRAMRKHTNMDAVEWLLCDHGFPAVAADCESWGGMPLGRRAAQEGRQRLLQHLCQRDLHTPGPADMRAALEDTAYSSARERALGVVRWLHARGVPTFGPALSSEGDFDRRPHHPAVHAPDFLTFLAARRGALEPLQVLVEECGAMLGESACVAAAEGGHFTVFRWLVGQRCPSGVDTWCAALRCRFNDVKLRTLELLHAEKRPWSEVVWAAAAADVEVRAWLKERGCPGSQEAPAVIAAEAAAATGTGAGAGVGGEAPA